MQTSQAQIIATLGPSSFSPEIIYAMCEKQLGVIRLNFSWNTLDNHAKHISDVRKVEHERSISLPIIQDLPGPRIQKENSHTYDHDSKSAITEHDIDLIRFGVTHGVDYIAVSFVASAQDILMCREIIKNNGGKQKVIAKIERVAALQNLDEIIHEADAVMIARGDLGNNIPIEKIPFVQSDIISKCKKAGKPVIVATQMMLSMTKNQEPTRAEVTDVAEAILDGADCVMLSEETASGNYPVESVAIMEKIVLEAEKHIQGKIVFNHLQKAD
jgi:pyruvate kinase